MPPPGEAARMRLVQEPVIGQVLALINAHPGTLSLGQGVVYYPPPPAALEALGEFIRYPERHKYLPVLGLPALHDAWYNKLARDNAIAPGPHWGLAITAGGNMAVLTAILATCDPGDEVILLRPYYFNHDMAIGIAGCRAVMVDCEADLFPDPERVAAAITPRTRMVITVSPNNPSGRVYPPEITGAINDLCRRRGIFHLHDEAYEYFAFEDATHVSPASFPGAEEHTLTVHSFSKSYGMASWRVGCLLAPARLLPAIRKIMDTNLICAPAMSQYAALGALAAGRAWLAPRVATLAAARRAVLAALAPLGDRLLVVPSRGAMYLLVRLDTPASGMEVVTRLVAEHRVAVIPGETFGLDQACWLRIAYGALTAEATQEALERLSGGLAAILAR